jgi:hypothetical protein
MSQVEMLEQNIKQLSPSDLAVFRSWFIEFDAADWDCQIETDSATGKLDRLAQAAIEEYHLTHPCTSKKPANTDQSA